MSDPIDTGPAPGLKKYTLKEKPEKALPELDGLGIDQLLQLRDDIDARLPATNLRDFNLEQATLLHYLSLRELQKGVNTADDVPTNQKAQVANSISAALKEITKMRNEIYNAEQFRLMEGALAKALKDMPADFVERFFALYGKKAEEMANAGPDPS
jgi:hypothetical protein